MHSTKYRYNPTTCRYEPVPFKAGKVLLPLTLFLLSSGVLFTLILFLHSVFVTTDKEVVLKDYNRTLRFHHRQLTSDMASVNSKLASLRAADKDVQEKLAFDQSPQQVLASIGVIKLSQQHRDFEKQYQQTGDKTTDLLQRSRFINDYFSRLIEINKGELSNIINVPSIQPIDNDVLTGLASGYGNRPNPFHKADYFHNGVDFIAPRGANVYATANGLIVEVKRSDLPMGQGNTIEIDHGNGLRTRYCNLGELLVKQGQRINRGSIIAKIGLSGGSISPHLHYEVIRKGKHVNPIDFMLDGLSPENMAALQRLASQPNQALD